MNGELHEAVVAELANSCEDADRLGICLFPTSRTEAQLLGSRVASGELVRVRRGLFAPASTWKTLDTPSKVRRIAKTLGILHRTWVFSHTTAAFIHGFSVSYKFETPIHYVTGRLGGGSSGRDLVHHRSNAFAWGKRDGMKVTSPAKTVCDCARICGLPDALAIADSAVRMGEVSIDQLREYADHTTNHRGLADVRRMLSCVDSRSESGGESIVRGTLIEAGFRIHDLQLVVPDVGRPGRTHRLDIVLQKADGGLVDLEIDGKDKYENLEMTGGRSAVDLMMRERQREASITAHGLPVVRVSAKDGYDTQLLVSRLAAYGVYPEAAAESETR